MPRTGHFATGGSVATETVETDQKPSPHKANKKALRASIPQHLRPEELFGRIASEDEVITWKDLRRGVRLQLRIAQDAMDDDGAAAVWERISHNPCVDELLHYAGFETKAEREARAERERLEELERIRLAQLAEEERRRQAAVDNFDSECIPLKTLKLIVKRLKDLTVQEYIFEHMHDVGMSIPVFPEETLREAIYHHLDRNGDGSLECGEFKDIVRGRLRITRFDLDDDGLERLVNAVDQDGSGDIDMDELHALLERGAAYDDDVLREGDDEVALRLGLDKTWQRPCGVLLSKATGRLVAKPDHTLPFSHDDVGDEVRVVTPREALYNRLECKNAQKLPRIKKEGRHLSLFPNVILYGEKPRRPSKAAMLHESSYLRTAAPTIPRTAPDRIEMTPFEATGAHAEMAPPEKWTRTAAQREKVLADLELAGVYE
jgi:hypothetical protein